MPNPNRLKILQDYLTKEVEMYSVYTESIPMYFPERDKLIEYHPDKGKNYSVSTCKMVDVNIPAGPDMRHLYLQIVASGAGWNDVKSKDLIESLRFIPVPEIEVGGRQSVLMMKRIPLAQRKVIGTNWYLLNAMISKIEIEKVTLTEVMFAWEYILPANGPLSEPVLTCWKYKP